MKRVLLVGVLLAIALAVAASLAVGEILSRPTPRQIGSPPADLQAETVLFHTSSGQRIAGWIVPGEKGSGAILLLHGVRSDRRQMVGRARFLRRLGYSVLLIDLPSHGESDGDRITFGARESAGVEAAISYLSHKCPNETIGVIGVSLGAAAAVLSKPVRAPDALVLESMYPTIEEATSNRLRYYLGAIGPLLTPILVAQLPLREGVSLGELRPIDAIKRLSVPVLIASGAIDHDTTLLQTKRIFEAANAPKELWVVEGADHVDLHGYATAPYEARIGAFLSQYMKKDLDPK